MKYAIFGCGYVGIIKLSCLAVTGNLVNLIINRSPAKSASIYAGKSPISRQGFDDPIRKNIGRTLISGTEYRKMQNPKPFSSRWEHLSRTMGAQNSDGVIGLRLGMNY